MKNNSDENLQDESQLFVGEDDYAKESAIYFEIASEEFKSEISFVMEESKTDEVFNAYFWEENDEFGIYN